MIGNTENNWKLSERTRTLTLIQRRVFLADYFPQKTWRFKRHTLVWSFPDSERTSLVSHTSTRWIADCPSNHFLHWALGVIDFIICQQNPVVVESMLWERISFSFNFQLWDHRDEGRRTTSTKDRNVHDSKHPPSLRSFGTFKVAKFMNLTNGIETRETGKVDWT